MKTTLVLIVTTIALGLTLKFIVAPLYDRDVSARFIERLSYIPSQNSAPLNLENLSRWLADVANQRAISGYVFPVLFPFDIAFLVCLGASLGLVSTGLAGEMPIVGGVPSWAWWLFPVFYVITDLGEDTLFALLCKSALSLTERSFALLRSLTKIKIATVSVAFAQAGMLGLLWAFLKILPSSGGSQ